MKSSSDQPLWRMGPAGLVSARRVLAIARYSSTPIRRAARSARAEGLLIDLTFGRACRWVLFLDTGHLVLASDDFPGELYQDGLEGWQADDAGK